MTFIGHANLQGLSRSPLFNARVKGNNGAFQTHEVEDRTFRELKQL